MMYLVGCVVMISYMASWCDDLKKECQPPKMMEMVGLALLGIVVSLTWPFWLGCILYNIETKKPRHIHTEGGETGNDKT